MPKLKHCPFCGCDEITEKIGGRILCELCHGTAPHAAQWNQRPDEKKILASMDTVAHFDQSLPPNSDLHDKLCVNVYFKGKHPRDVQVLVLAKPEPEGESK